MGIGTSMGAYYDDAFHQAAAQWDSKYDDNVINTDTLEPTLGESPTPLTRDMNNLHPHNFMKSNLEVKDPNLIYDDQGNIVDYATKLEPLKPKDRDLTPIDSLQPLIQQQGMKTHGNIDLNNRPVVKNEDGSISTVRSLSIGTDDGEVLIPTVHPDGYIMSDEHAIQHYKDTGQHLGIFDTPEAATEYAKKLHTDQEQLYNLSQD